MGNFEKLSVLVIVVIIVMILVVALYTWTDNPESTPEPSVSEQPAVTPAPANQPLKAVAKNPAKDDWTKLPDPFTDPFKPGVGTKPEKVKVGENGEAVVAEKPTAKPDPALEKPAPVEDVSYVVKSGDSYGKIAQNELGAYKHWTEIEKLNGIPPERLREGMKLKLPRVGKLALASTDGKAPAPKTEPVASTGDAWTGGSTYTVRKGDTIETIAQKTLKSASRWPDIWYENLDRLDDPRALVADMTLKIPAR
jgi:nucleoid-associated protein YgaU